VAALHLRNLYRSFRFRPIELLTDMRICIIIGLSCILMFAVGFVVCSAYSLPIESRFAGTIGDVFPMPEEVPGWSLREEVIADTPEVRRSVNELLDYDSARFVTYYKGAQRISVYIAYWRAGKVSPRTVRGHTPDVCWPSVGWEIVQSKHAVALNADAWSQTRCELRHMRLQGRDEWVAFWHIVGGEHQSALGRSSRFSDILRDMRRYSLRQKQEQVFVRISGPVPPEFWPRDVTSALLERLETAFR
jgi:hypothetical protein